MASWIRKKIRGRVPNRDGAALALQQQLEEQSTTRIPSHSCEGLAPKPQLSSKFFTCLSAELRIAILTAAFGDRTVHIFYDEEKVNQRKGYLRSLRQNIKGSKQDCEPAKVSGAVCRRSRYAQDLLTSSAIFSDRCYGLSETDDFWPEDYLAEIRIGALGWLLCCRQAYMEGIDILYSTNTFHITSPALSGQLPSFIPLQLLARIRRIEFAWDWGRLTREVGEVAFQRQLKSMIENIPKELPLLSSLKIAFQNSLWPMSCLSDPSPGSFKQWLEQKVLEPLDGVVRGLPILGECEVYFIASTHWYMVREMRTRIKDGKFWRDVGDVGEGKKNGKEKQKGYWVCEGRDDAPTVSCWIVSA